MYIQYESKSNKRVKMIIHDTELSPAGTWVPQVKNKKIYLYKKDKIDKLQLPTRIENALLMHTEIESIEDFINFDYDDFFKVRNLGTKTVRYLLDLRKNIILVDGDRDMAKHKQLELINREAHKEISLNHNDKKTDIIEFTKTETVHNNTPHLTNSQKDRLIYIKNLYDELGSLQAVSGRVGISRERVRQLLIKGTKHKLYKHEKPNIVKERELKEKLSKDLIRSEIVSGLTILELCKKYNISQEKLRKLFKIYNINSREYLNEKRYNYCVNKYSKIVDYLGHHPSSTELQSRDDWRNLNMRIDRQWGSIENFRKTFGIEKPKHAMHPNTIKAWNNAKNKRIENKKRKLKLVELEVEKRELVSLKELHIALGIKPQSLVLYLKDLIADGKIFKIKQDNHRVFYSSLTKY